MNPVTAGRRRASKDARLTTGYGGAAIQSLGDGVYRPLDRHASLAMTSEGSP